MTKAVSSTSTGRIGEPRVRPGFRHDGAGRARRSSLLALAVLLAVFSLAPGRAVAQAPAAAPPKIPVEARPATPPAWLAGYRLRFPLRVVGDPAAQAAAATVMARLPVGGWLRPDGGDVAVQNAAGQPVPVSVLSHDPAGHTVIQFPRTGNDEWYWAYAANPAAPAAGTAPPAPEGLVAEFRQWAAAEPIDAWANVVEGLKKNQSVIGNAPLAEVISTMNPARPSEPRNYAASYRGFLNIKTPGAYRFLANAQDAAFLFIDGHKVFERGGTNERLTGSIPVSKNGALIDLAAGVHPFELHHVVGENPASFGFCVLLWVPPGANQWAYVPPDAFAQPMLATAGAVEEAAGGQAATISWGIDDVLSTVSQTLYLVRFEAQGSVKDPAQLTWDLGDGTTATGRSVSHVYFKEGPYPVKLTSAAGLPPAQRTAAVWNAPVVSSPFAPGKAVAAMSGWDLTKLDAGRLRQTFNFLRVCEQTDHWPFLERVARQVLAGPNVDPPSRAAAHAALMEALARQGKADAALAHAEPAQAEFAKTPSLLVRIKLQAGEVNHRQLRDLEAAAKVYRGIVEQHRRLKVPEVRLAAIRLGDLFAEAGEMPKAADAYRQAATLGGAEFDATAQTGAITRGAMLRVAEQRLRGGDVAQTRQLMEKIELDYPEQKLEGLYRFLRAEADRAAGRYEDAIGNYEVLLKLPQWAGYRSKALFGIADSYARAGDVAKAVEWLDTLEESFPSFYDEQKLTGYRRSIEARQSRAKRAAAAAAAAAKGGGAAGSTAAAAVPASFNGFATGFEPDDPTIGDSLTGCLVVPGLGMAGAGHVGLLESMTAMTAQSDWSLRVRDVAGGGYAWVELWYRETRNSLPTNSHTHAWLYGTGTDLDPLKGTGTIYWNYTYGQWRKLGFLVRAPAETRDGRAATSVRHVWGAVEVDALSVTPVSDRQYDAMLNFARQDGIAQ